MSNDKRPMEWNIYGHTDTAVLKMPNDCSIAFNVSPMHAHGYLGQAHLSGKYKQAAIVSITASGREECKRNLITDVKNFFSVIHSGLLVIGDEVEQ